MAVDSDTDTDSDPARDYIRRMFPFADKLDPSVHAYEELYLQPRSEPKAEAKPPPEQPKPPEKKPIDLPEPNWQQLYPVHQQANLTPMPQPAQFGLDSRQQAASGFEVFKNPLIWIGILGSLLTRRPALAAMTFAGSAMKGYDEGKHDIFKENKEKFDEAVKQVEAQNRIETERYKELWTTGEELNWQKQLPKIWEEAAKNGDKTLMQLLQMGAPKEQIEKYFEQRGAQQDAIAKALAIDKGKTDLRNAEITELKSDPEVRKAAERVYELRSAPPNLAGFAGNNPRNQAIMAVVDDIGVERGKKYDASKWFGKLAAQRVADSAEIRAKSNALSDLQRQRSNVAAFQATNVTNGKRLLQLAEKVDDTGVPVMNRWIRGGRTAIEGDPDTAAFNAQLFLWSTDTAKIVTQPRLTGQLTDAARHEVAAFIPGGATLEQLQSLVGTLNQDANSRITQLDVQINDLTHDIRGLSDNIRSGTLSEQQQFNRKQFKDENGNPVWGVQDPDTGEWRPE